jgi:hypothetical protein
MSIDSLVCKNEKRRDLIRTKLREEYIHEDKWNGLDYIEVDEDHRILRVYFINRAPKKLRKENVLIEGGKRVRNIRVTEIKLCPTQDYPEKDDCMLVTVDKPGDFSPYSLSLVKLDQNGRQTDEPFTGFEPRYSKLEFSFIAGCSSDLDCKPRPICPKEIPEDPEINYLAKDYASFRQLILDRLALKMPSWTERHVPDLGIALAEILAYVGDYLSYYQDAVATEAYLSTARQRISVRRHVRLVDYAMHEGCNSRAFICINTNEDLELNVKDFYFITGSDSIKRNETVISEEDIQSVPLDSYEIFEPLIDSPLIESSSILFGKGDITPDLIDRLKDQDLISLFIRNELSDNTKKLLEQYPGPDAPFEELQNLLISDLNRLIQFGKLNRSMLEDLYPDEIAKAQKVHLYAAHSEISFYTWGNTECCLSKGATSATLEDKFIQGSRLKLKAGDILILEEKLGPQSGQEADANIAHSCAVRLTKVNPEAIDATINGKLTRIPGPIVVDPLTNQPIVEIKWHPDDAIPFPLCISAVDNNSTDCSPFKDPISVARGNVVLVDHGMTVIEKLDGSVSSIPAKRSCEGEILPAEIDNIPEKFRPCLRGVPLTFNMPLLESKSANKILLQDPRNAVPQMTLIGASSMATSLQWTAKGDLLGSYPDDQHFVAELDNDGITHIRFGDGTMGKMPEAGTEFTAIYRIGCGNSGNVGVNAISHMVFRSNIHLGSIKEVKNPMPSLGGIDPEPLETVRQFAPISFRKNQERCITAEDYARMAETDPRVQKAAAELNWTGSWFEVKLAIDPYGSENLDEVLRQDIESRLKGYKRIGYDLRVKGAQYVPIYIAINVCVKSDYLRGNVEAALMDIFSNRRLPNGTLGLFYPDNLTFGDAVYLSKLVATAQSVPGVESLEVTKFERMGIGPKNEIKEGSLPIGPLEIAQMDNDPNLPENGRLILNLIGGR